MTVPWVREAVHGAASKLVMVTAYDAQQARTADAAGVDLILVGDSLAMVVLGHADTLSVTMDEMLHHVKAARRGAKNALLVADMPYGSFHLGEAAGGGERAAFRQGRRRPGGQDRRRAAGDRPRACGPPRSR